MGMKLDFSYIKIRFRQKLYSLLNIKMEAKDKICEVQKPLTNSFNNKNEDFMYERGWISLL